MVSFRFNCKVALLSAGVLFFQGTSGTARAEEIILTGVGATFPYLLYRKWIDVYSREKNVTVRYKPVGSGQGIQSIEEYSVDFGATDVFLTDGNRVAGNDTILHLPTCIGAIVITYNLPGNPHLKLTPEQIVNLFLGRISRWNSSDVKKNNPDANLPDLPVVVVHRSEGSGSTGIFTHYLAGSSLAWKTAVGSGRKVRWPAGMGVKGNAGIADMIHRVPGSIGYIELNYTEKERLPRAAVRNRHGQYITPDVRTVSAAAQRNLPPDARVFLTGDVPRGAYPICAFTYIIVRQEQAYSGRSLPQAVALAEFLRWMSHEAQQYAEDFMYAPLPPAVVNINDATLARLRYNGKAVTAGPDRGIR